MTNLKESELSMLFTTKDYVAQYASITNSLPNFTINATLLVNTIPQILTIAEQQKIDKQGITDSKNQLKENLVLLAADTARKLTAYAKLTNNLVLAKEINYSPSKLRQVADTATRDYAQIIYNRAQTSVAALATYGITAATQTALLGAITAYATIIGKPRLGITETSQATKQLALLFKTAKTALENMDAAVEIVRISQPNFYNGYKSARKITVTGSGALSLKGLITDAKTGEPIKGVSISFVQDGGVSRLKSAKAVDNIVKKSASKGGFNVKGMPAGNYTVTVKKNGYADQVATVAVTDGERSELKIVLSKN